MKGPAPAHLADALDWLHEQGKLRSEAVPELDVEETLLKVRTAGRLHAAVLEVGPSTPMMIGSRLARDHVRRSIQGWNVDESGQVTDEAILLTSELVTNALTHGDVPVTVAVSLSGGQLRVEVHDSSPVLPIVPDADDALTGRGFVLVSAIATEWGFYTTATGKAVYFVLDCR
jgi:hypothetical protein